MKPNKAYCGKNWTLEETEELVKAWCETGSWVKVAKRVSLISHTRRTVAMCRHRWGRLVQGETRRAAKAADTTVTKPSVSKRAIDGASADCRTSDNGTHDGTSATHNVLKERLDGSLDGMAPRPAHDPSRLLECDYFRRFWTQNNLVDSLGLKPESIRFPPGVMRLKRVGIIDAYRLPYDRDRL